MNPRVSSTFIIRHEKVKIFITFWVCINNKSQRFCQKVAKKGGGDVGVWITEGPLYSVLSLYADQPMGGEWVKGGQTQVMNMQKQRLYVHTTDMTLRYTPFLLSNYSPPFLLGNYSPPFLLGNYLPPFLLGNYSPPFLLGNYSPPFLLGNYSPPFLLGNYLPPFLLGNYLPPFLLGNYSPPFLLGYHYYYCINAKYYTVVLAYMQAFTEYIRRIPEVVE